MSSSSLLLAANSCKQHSQTYQAPDLTLLVLSHIMMVPGKTKKQLRKKYFSSHLGNSLMIVLMMINVDTCF